MTLNTKIILAQARIKDQQVGEYIKKQNPLCVNPVTAV
jgi:hypothetical protein